MTVPRPTVHMLLESLDCTLRTDGQTREVWEAPDGRPFQVPYRRINGEWVTLRAILFRIMEGLNPTG